MDCHRTWEALILGNIVLVQGGSLDDMFEGLPVVPIYDWSSVSKQKLREWARRYGPLTQDVEVRKKLEISYWISKIRESKHEEITLIICYQIVSNTLFQSKMIVLVNSNFLQHVS